MATVSGYWPLLIGIKNQFETQFVVSLNPMPLIVVEQQFKAEQSWIGIYLDRRDAPEGQQNLQNGKRTRFLCRVAIWCWEYAIDPDMAIKRALEVTEQVELSTMFDRTFGGKCNTSWIEGGQMATQVASKTNTVTFVGTETILNCDVTAYAGD